MHSPSNSLASSKMCVPIEGIFLRLRFLMKKIATESKSPAQRDAIAIPAATPAFNELRFEASSAESTFEEF